MVIRKDGKNSFSRTTLADVARESGFSPSTISIVLNEAPISKYVAAKTKEHIRAVAKRWTIDRTRSGDPCGNGAATPSG